MIKFNLGQNYVPNKEKQVKRCHHGDLIHGSGMSDAEL